MASVTRYPVSFEFSTARGFALVVRTRDLPDLKTSQTYGRFSKSGLAIRLLAIARPNRLAGP